jgi:predicted transcriptional regulator
VFILKVSLYDEQQNNIQALFRSRLQTQVLLALIEGPGSLAELREVTGSTSQALIPKIRLLESKRYVLRNADGYALSPSGRILGTKICEVVKTIAAIEHNRDFWSMHYMEAIPHPFLDDIGCLSAARLITNTTGDVFRSFQNYQSLINSAEVILGVTSIMSTFHADLLASRVAAGIRVELIVNPPLVEDLAKEPYLEKLQALAEYPDFRIHVAPGVLNIGMTVTDAWLSLGLYNRETLQYDHTSDLVCDAPEAIGWGWRLFEYFLTDSREANFFR